MRRVSIAVSSVVLFLLLVGIVVVSLSWRSDASQKVEEMAGLPLVLSPDRMSSDKAIGELTLREDGVAILSNFPIGDIGERGGSSCLAWDGASTFTGTARWTADDDYIITVIAGGGRTLIGPYHPTFSDVVWYKFGVPGCNAEDTLWYWAESE